ncbi:hypothetical protein QUF80_22305 [Desulfococcaceae bacterium HSG8]|nr:hypothetical protein [Desulfococcaceae bacterium HSG8]
MISYGNLIRELPAEVQFPMMKILDQLRGEVSDMVTITDFRRLENVVSVLGDKILELAEAQKRTEMRVEELAEAQKRTEMRVEELAEAQKRTERRVEELAEAQKRTEIRVEELAEAQKRTEDTLSQVVGKQDRMAREVGGLSTSFGYFLENEAIRFLPDILKREKGIDIRVMDRRFIVYADGKDDEINIYGEGLRDGREVYVIGESKSQLGKKDVDRFRKLVRRVTGHLKSEVHPLFVTHSAHPNVEAYAKENMPELTIYRSYKLKKHE